jgi:hypothetical protein
VILTALWGRRKEANLDFFLAKFIGKLNHCIPGSIAAGVEEQSSKDLEADLPGTNCLLVLV